jgi:hypothetical protein
MRTLPVFCYARDIMRRLMRLKTATGLLLGAVILRAAIPVGYMPASMGSGFLFEMCPSAVPAELLDAVTGTAQSAHHSAGPHAQHHSGSAGSQSAGSHFDTSHCPIGQLLGAAVLVGEDVTIDVAPVPADWFAVVYRRPESRKSIRSHSRDPPA